MDTSKLRKFASFARSALIEQVGTRLKTVLAEKSLARRESPRVVEEIEKKIKELGEKRFLEMVAYTWFNRFCALRYMDVNRYTRIGVLSPVEGQFQPEILSEAKMGHIDEELVPEATRKQVIRLLDGSDKSSDPQGEAYRLLLVAVCNYYHSLMPFMFEKIADYTELLLPDDLLSGTSIPAYTREALLPINCSPEHTEESVEVIGWLYQFYIGDKKDEVFEGLKKGKKITAENIPAATQLFTPHWIVRYLVENSLGRLWMLNHPDSKLVDRMDYYITPEKHEIDFIKIASPEEIKVCDPACGSGHMLTYAFDLLYEIYREEQYSEPEIPSLIFKNNLYGIEIDPRAGALAAFALTMKAREKDKRFFTRKLQSGASTSDSSTESPNICVLENIKIDPDDLSAYIDKVGRDLFTDGLQGVVNQWENADNFGSLIRPVVTDVSEAMDLLSELQIGQDLFLAKVHQLVLKALKQAKFLSPKYHVVVANPPYMGRKGMDATLKEFAQNQFNESKADLYAMFIVRNRDMVVADGLVAMITMHSWMFLSSFEELRAVVHRSTTVNSMLHLGARAFDTIGGEVVSTTAFILQKRKDPVHRGVYLKLVSGRSEAEKIKLLLANRVSGNLRYRSSSAELSQIAGAPFAYWADPEILAAFRDFDQLDKVVEIRQGLATGDNDRFLREWHEVSYSRFATDIESTEQAFQSGKKWFPYNKGGGYRKWYGNNGLVICYDEPSYKVLKTAGNFCPSDQFYFHPGITWTLISRTPSFRAFPKGYVIGHKGCGIYSQDESRLKKTLGYLNSHAAASIVKLISSGGYEVGHLKRLPLDITADLPVDTIVDELCAISKRDWDSEETSWDFSQLEILGSPYSCLGDAYDSLSHAWTERIARCQTLEESNHQVFAEMIYGDDHESSASIADVALNCNPLNRYGSDKCQSELVALLLADTMRELVSYAVGCMFGRYSLDRPGLILANLGESVADYRKQIPEPRFAPDGDNVVPILEGEWFADDISQRFKVFLKVTFGIKHYEENLEFLEDAIYADNPTAKNRKTIRDYFLKDFYNHHLKMYKKRPIYWLFSSPKGTFNALIYMHRYRPETVGKVLECLRDFRDKLVHHAEHRQMTADSASASKTERTQAVKDVAAIKKQLKELEAYEKSLFEVASRMRNIDIDLDNGVKHNYLLFGPVLRKIPGLAAKED